MTSDKRIIKRYLKVAHKIISLEDQYSKLTDEQIKENTFKYKKRYKNGESLDSLLIEVYANAREAAFRILGLKAYPVQLVGAIILHYGDISEMKTGEGKTLTGLFPAYLNALTEKSVHIVTVNEYLSKRDSMINGRVFEFLGLTYGFNGSNLNSDEKREAYSKDITYTTNSELGFDYLRDNLVKSLELKVQRGLNYVIIDEADSVLIDEARTPLIISGGSQNRINFYKAADQFAKSTNKSKDIIYDVETKQVGLTPQGIKKAEEFFSINNLFELKNAELYHLIINALRANYTFKHGVEYMVRDNEIHLIDQFTGRIMEGRAYSDGLQQSIQAKEGVYIEEETVTLATITYQNFYRLYSKISGMTGTAKTEEEEFIKIYNTRVIACPTNKPVIRKDLSDLTFGTKRAKLKKLIKDVQEQHEIGRPILIGTTSVESSERVARYLENANLQFEMINAKNHYREADIVERAGQFKAITLATNMAGRGTDIKLTDQTRELGGLYVMGIERNEARRIDNQLRGRSGRQGDPGTSRFYISMEDEMMVRFANPRVRQMFLKLGDDHIQSKMFTRAITNAQKKLEGLNFDQRKNILEYDNILSQQREAIYSQRDALLKEENLKKVISRFFFTFAFESVIKASEIIHGEKIVNLDILFNNLKDEYIKNGDYDKLSLQGLEPKEIAIKIQKMMLNNYNERTVNMPLNVKTSTERSIILDAMDEHWTIHINLSEKLKSGIYLQQYAQNNPLHEYVEESASQFAQMKINITFDAVKKIMNIANAVEYSEPKSIEISEDYITQILENLSLQPNEFSRSKVKAAIENKRQMIGNDKKELEQLNLYETILQRFMNKLDKDFKLRMEHIYSIDEIYAIKQKFDFESIKNNPEKLIKKVDELMNDPNNDQSDIFFESLVIKKIIEEGDDIKPVQLSKTNYKVKLG